MSNTKPGEITLREDQGALNGTAFVAVSGVGGYSVRHFGGDLWRNPWWASRLSLDSVPPLDFGEAHGFVLSSIVRASVSTSFLLSFPSFPFLWVFVPPRSLSLSLSSLISIVVLAQAPCFVASPQHRTHQRRSVISSSEMVPSATSLVSPVR